jgi:ATP-dependent DNA helicase PIF1
MLEDDFVFTPEMEEAIRLEELKFEAAKAASTISRHAVGFVNPDADPPHWMSWNKDIELEDLKAKWSNKFYAVLATPDLAGYFLDTFGKDEAGKEIMRRLASVSKVMYILTARRRDALRVGMGKSLRQLTERQYDAVYAALIGSNVFLTGKAGSGKSLVLKAIIDTFERRHIHHQLAVTATTGNAALQINGTTFHSFLGCGLAEDKNVKKWHAMIKQSASVRNTYSTLLKTKTLLIDEISMLDGDLFQFASDLLEAIRSNRGTPFGGIQIIACGDFYQLSPVPEKEKANLPPNYCYTTKAWRQLFSDNDAYILRKAFRQRGKAQEHFVELLDRLAKGELHDGDKRAIESRTMANVMYTFKDRFSRELTLAREKQGANGSGTTAHSIEPYAYRKAIGYVSKDEWMKNKLAESMQDVGLYKARLEEYKGMVRTVLTVKPELLSRDTGFFARGSTNVYSYNNQVQEMNRLCVGELNGKHVTYSLYDSMWAADEEAKTTAVDSIESIVYLKPGAAVILTKNPSNNRELANGSRGVIVKFISLSNAAQFASIQKSLERGKTVTDGRAYLSTTVDGERTSNLCLRRVPQLGAKHLAQFDIIPVVKFDCQDEDALPYVVLPFLWMDNKGQIEGNVEDADDYESVTVSPANPVCVALYMPLKLGYAATVHSLQGKTLFTAAINAGKWFAPGHAYSAFSRVTSMDSLVLTCAKVDFTGMKCDPNVKAFYERLISDQTKTGIIDGYRSGTKAKEKERKEKEEEAKKHRAKKRAEALALEELKQKQRVGKTGEKRKEPEPEVINIEEDEDSDGVPMVQDLALY